MAENQEDDSSSLQSTRIFFIPFFAFQLQNYTRPLIPSPFSSLNKSLCFSESCEILDGRNIQSALGAHPAALTERHECTLHGETRDLAHRHDGLAVHKVKAQPKTQHVHEVDREREASGSFSRRKWKSHRTGATRQCVRLLYSTFRSNG